MRHIIAGVVALVLTTATLPAQTPGPAACARSANDRFNAAYRAARDSAAMPGGKAADVQGLLTMRTARMQECARQFSVDRTSGADLLPLAALYSQVGFDSLAMAAVNKRLAEPGLTEVARAQALDGMIRALIKPDTLLIARAEPYMQRLDAMSDAVLGAKLDAHSALDGEYRYLDVDARIRQHSLAIIALGKQVKAASAATHDSTAVNAFLLLEAYTDLAEVEADLGHLDSTFTILDQAAVDHPEFSAADIDNIIKPERARYMLVGQPAMALVADHWLNAPATTRTFEPSGHVSVIEFTAHWCVPCRNSYPAMVAMAGRFGAQGARFVFATEFYGYLGTRQHLDASAEFAADHEYYVDQHGIHFPVAIADAPPPYQPGKPFVSNINDTHYQVGGIPQTVIIDRRGIIRRILTGWDTGNAERIPQLLDELLRDPSTTRP